MTATRGLPTPHMPLFRRTSTLPEIIRSRQPPVFMPIVGCRVRNVRHDSIASETVRSKRRVVWTERYARSAVGDKL